MLTHLRAACCAAIMLTAAVAGCGGAPQPLIVQGHGAAPQPTAAATVPPQPVTASIGVQLDPASGTTYAGERVTVTVLGNLYGDPGQWSLAQATVDFGDGSSQSVTASCTGQGSSTLTASHVYQAGGSFTIRVTAARLCNPDEQPDLSSASGSMLALPAPPSGSAAWPQCTQAQVQMLAQLAARGLGNRELLFTLRNVSSWGCQTYGYPGLRLADPDGPLLPVTVERGGAYLFPSVQPSRVVLAPGDVASFDVGYVAGVSAASGCDLATEAQIFLPGSFAYTPVSLSGIDGPTGAEAVACGGNFGISPVIPGDAGIRDGF
jgi:hypothetical protein